MTFNAGRIRFRHLRCFLAVAQHGSATKAAGELNTSQPALSRSLRELEQEIGQPLFVRTGSGLALTPAGENYRQSVSAAMAQIERGTHQAKGAHLAQSVSIGMLPNVTRTLIPEATARFKKASPEIKVALHWHNVKTLIETLRKGETDMIVGRLLSLEHMAGMSFEHLFDEPLIFTVSAQHPLARQADPSLSQINNYTVLTPLAGTIIRNELNKFLVARGFVDFDDSIETVSFEFARAYLAGNDAVACVPLSAVSNELATGKLVKLPIWGEELNSSVGITKLSEKQLSKPAMRFAATIRHAAQKYQGISRTI